MPRGRAPNGGPSPRPPQAAVFLALLAFAALAGLALPLLPRLPLPAVLAFAALAAEAPRLAGVRPRRAVGGLEATLRAAVEVPPAKYVVARFCPTRERRPPSSPSFKGRGSSFAWRPSFWRICSARRPEGLLLSSSTICWTA
jgi:hypothetical protein